MSVEHPCWPWLAELARTAKGWSRPGQSWFGCHACHARLVAADHERACRDRDLSGIGRCALSFGSEQPDGIVAPLKRQILKRRGHRETHRARPTGALQPLRFKICRTW